MIAFLLDVASSVPVNSYHVHNLKLWILEESYSIKNEASWQRQADSAPGINQYHNSLCSKYRKYCKGKIWSHIPV